MNVELFDAGSQHWIDEGARWGAQEPGGGSLPVIEEGRAGKEGEDSPALPHDPLSRSQSSEHCPGPKGLYWGLPCTGSTTGRSQMNSLGSRRAWHLACAFWDGGTDSEVSL